MGARFMALALVLVGAATAVTGDAATAQALHPDLTPDQSSRLQAAIDAQGCSGGSVVIGASEFTINGPGAATSGSTISRSTASTSC